MTSDDDLPSTQPENQPGDDELLSAGLRFAFGTGHEEHLQGISLQPSDVVRESRTDRYEFLHEVARGGVGVVWRVHDKELGRDLALKMLQSQHADSSRMALRLVEEAQIGSQLQHPGIVPIHELGTTSESLPFFTMKLVKGRTLAEVLQDRDDPTQERQRFLAVFEKICQTMAYAHSRRVIHRDLKPANIMVGAFGEVQVMDWGLAKVTGKLSPSEPLQEDTQVLTVRDIGSDTDSLTGSVMGTPAYMSPEQARGLVDKLDQRTDVFALGAMLCEILTGRPPFEGKSSQEVQAKAREGDVAPAIGRVEAAGADPEVTSLACRCLAVDPDERPANAGIVAQEITRYLTSLEERAQASQIEAAEARVSVQHERKIRRLTVTLAATVLITIAVGAGVYIRQESERAQHRAEVTLQVKEALQRADRFRELARGGEIHAWDRAADEAHRAASLATDLVPPELRTQANEVLSEILVASERASRDRRMLERLAQIAEAHESDQYVSGEDPPYAEAFREYGIDFDLRRPNEIVSALRDQAISVEMAAALDDWSHELRDRYGPDSTRWRDLLQIAIQIDPDQQRAQLREAIARDDLASLSALVDSADLREPSAGTAILLASALTRGGDAENAERVLVAARNEYPGSFEVAHALGKWYCYGEQKNLTEALRHITAASAIRPESAHIWLDLGVILGYLQRFEESVEAYSFAIARRPRYSHAMQNRGYSRMRLRQYVLAEKDFLKAIEYDPGNVHAYDNLSRCYRYLGEPEKAIEARRRATRANPDNAEQYYRLGSVLKESGQAEEAIAAYKAAVRVDPRHAEAQSNLGFMLMETNRFAEGAEALALGIELGQNKKSYPVKKARAILAECKRLQERSVQLERLSDGGPFPTDAKTILQLAKHSARLGQPRKSARLYRSALQSKPELFAKPGTGRRTAAAFAASLASQATPQAREFAIPGESPEPTTPDEWLQQALDWLQQDFSAWQEALEQGKDAKVVRKKLQAWLDAPELEPLRTATPPEYASFWSQVNQVLDTVQPPANQ